MCVCEVAKAQHTKPSSYVFFFFLIRLFSFTPKKHTLTHSHSLTHNIMQPTTISKTVCMQKTTTTKHNADHNKEYTKFNSNLQHFVANSKLKSIYKAYFCCNFKE